MRVNVTSGKAIVDKLKSAATNDDELLEQKLEKATQPAVLDKSEMKEESLPASKEVTSVVAAKTAQVLVVFSFKSADKEISGAQIEDAVTKSKSGLLKPNNSQPNNQAEAAEKFAGKVSCPGFQFSDEDFAKVEDSHFIYYLVVFGVLMAVLYIGAHNKKKILGLLIEGRRPTGGSRRGSIRYRRLSQREDASETLSYRDNESNIIY
ncbi:unnamed protein product [Toxocara canis]|nr:unnamed protein product [Toxocara canis]